MYLSWLFLGILIWLAKDELPRHRNSLRGAFLLYLGYLVDVQCGETLGLIVSRYRSQIFHIFFLYD